MVCAGKFIWIHLRFKMFMCTSKFLSEFKIIVLYRFSAAPQICLDEHKIYAFDCVTEAGIRYSYSWNGKQDGLKINKDTDENRNADRKDLGCKILK